MLNKTIVKDIFFEALKEVLPKYFVKNNIKYTKKAIIFKDNYIPRDSYSDLYIFCVGKAAYDTAKECEEIFKDDIKQAVAVSLKNPKLEKIKKLKNIKHLTSTHPEVSKKSVKAANEIIKVAKKIKKDDLFLFFLSGGASAMIEKPNGISLKKFKNKTSNLLKSGIDIVNLNKIRKQLSNIKGGKLADHFSSKGFVFVLSDVLGDDINTIGSAPMNNGKFSHIILASNDIALKGAKDFLDRSLGKEIKKTKIFPQSINTSVKKCAEYIKNKIEKYDQKYNSFCLVFGGESYSKVQGKGKGGRNQELALRLLINDSLKEDMCILCAGTDGIDGNSNRSGAFLDNGILKKIKKQNVDLNKYLKNSDSCTFFKSMGYDFKTGITGTNVMDIVIVLKRKEN